VEEEEEQQSTIRKFKRSNIFTTSDEIFYSFQKSFENFVQKEDLDDRFKNYSSFGYFLLMIVILIIKKYIIFVLKKIFGSTNNRQIELVNNNRQIDLVIHQ
jgi:hypothetical protein